MTKEKLQQVRDALEKFKGMTFNGNIEAWQKLGQLLDPHIATLDSIIAGADGWMPIESAPINETVFLCRRKGKPWVTFDALIYQDQESWEIPNKYLVLHDLTNDKPLDDDWYKYEWQALPAAPKHGGDE